MSERELFLAALDLDDVEERARFLTEQCGDDHDRLKRLQHLLLAKSAAGSFLEPPANLAAKNAATVTSAGSGKAITTDHSRSGEQAGVVIANKYALVEQIGEGGMGSVWRARQTEPVKRFVAVKLIKAGMDSKQVLARFEAERQALALMDHPNIATVLDGGLHEGRPFFVMELVKGVPITEYCDSRKLTPKERLELFVPVCQAIQHAHQKGIIHRDIKPSNVLIALYDDRPVVKVIDFGVAKATGAALTERTIDTGFGGVVGTPQYMSPEQATFNNLDIDTRSDVYSLGVLLYELLTGSPPFSRAELEKQGLLEILRIVREEEPPKPSTKLSTALALPTLAANRGTEPGKLTKLLLSELDWIVLKALEKDRSRRYETANGFAGDVQRYLAGEPVVAHPPTVGYRLRKFYRKHRTPIVTALVVVVMLKGMAFFGWWQAHRALFAEAKAEQQRDQALAAQEIAATAAEQERQAKVREAQRADGEQKANLEAQAQKVKAEQAAAAEKSANAQAQKRLTQIEKANKLLASIFDNLDPREIAKAERPLQAILVEKLDQAISQLEGESIGDPLVVAAMQHNFAVSLMSLGEPAKAIVLLKKAVATFQAKVEPDDPSLIGSMNVLAVAYRDTGKLDLGLPLLEETFKVSKAKFGAEHPQTLTYMNNLAQAYLDLGKHDLAIPLVEETLKLSKAKLGPTQSNTLQTMNALACTYQTAGKPELALPLWEEALELMRTVLGPAHPTTLITMNNLAGGYQTAGQTDRALPLLEEALKLLKQKLGTEHPDTLECMRNLAVTYRVAGKLDLALPLFEETLKLRKAKFGPGDPKTLSIMNSLALAYEEAGKPEPALPLKVELFKHTKANLGAEHPETLRCMNNLAYSYWMAKQLDKSVPLFEETLKIKVAKFGREPLDTLMTAGNLGVNYKDAGRFKEAIPLLEEAYRAAKKHPTLQFMGSHLIEAYSKAGENAKLADLLLEQLTEARKALPQGSPQLAGLLAQISLGLLEQKKWTEAEPLLRESLAIREKTQPDAWMTFNTKSMLGGALLGQKRYADAEPLLVKGYEGMKAREKSIPSQATTRIPESLDRLIALYTAMDKPDEVKKLRAERTTYPGTVERAPMPREVK